MLQIIIIFEEILEIIYLENSNLILFFVEAQEHIMHFDKSWFLEGQNSLPKNII